MPRPIPHSLAESLPAPQEGSSESSGDVLRVHEGVGLPGEQELTRMDRSGASRELGNLAWVAAHEAQQTTVKLFAELIPTLHVPELSDFIEAGVDFAKLEASFEAYAQGNIAPELILAPVNLPLYAWEDAYSTLREWQDAHNASSSFRLQKRTDGDGLYITKPVVDAWDSLNGQAVADTPGSFLPDGGVMWKALVVPTASREQHGLAVHTSFDLTQTGNDFNTQASTIGLTQINPQEAHMPIGAYLTLQAGHTMDDKPLLDSNTYTWNAGTFEHDNSTKAPASSWNPGRGRVGVRHDRVVSSGDDLGVRLPVWG